MDSRNELVLRSNELRTSAELNSSIGDIGTLGLVIGDADGSDGCSVGCGTLASVLSVVVDDEGDAGGVTMLLLKLLTFMVCGMPLTMPTRSFLRGSGFWLALEFLFDCSTGDDLSLCFVDCSFAFAFAFALALDFLGEFKVDLESPLSWLAIVDCVFSWSDRCRMNWTSLEYSPHFVKIYFRMNVSEWNQLANICRINAQDLPSVDFH